MLTIHNKLLVIVLFMFFLGVIGQAQAGLFYQGPFKINPDGEKRTEAKVYLPKAYDSSNQKKWPLVVSLHGYRMSGNLTDYYFGLSYKTSSKGFVLLVPEGTPDKKGNKFWNATDSCCNFDQSEINDVDYLVRLINQTKTNYAIDPHRVYIIGQSNGGFMAHRLACEASELFAGIASFAGAMDQDPSKCNPKKPISVLQVHAEDDQIVHFQGGEMEGKAYPSTQATIGEWLKHNRCDEKFKEEGPFDFVRLIPGKDTTIRTWSNCDNKAEVSLWTIRAYPSRFHSPHGPWITNEVTHRTLDFLFSHSQ